MAVKNDSQTIGHSLYSLRGLIDCYAICDAGSTDNTLFIIDEIMKDLKVPGVIYRDRARGFAENEILRIHAAQKTLHDMGYSLDHSYILSLKPEQHIELCAEFKKNTLHEDAYLLLENCASLSYYKYQVNLTRASSVNKKPSAQSRLTSLAIGEHGAQDSKILEKNLKNASLPLLDLAQTYKALKKYDEALLTYQTLIEQNRSREEVWLAKYMIALCYEETQQWNKAASGYLEAFQHNRARPEPLYRLALYYRLQGQNDIAYLFAKQGAQIPVAHDATLFPAPLLHDYQFDEELSITAYYTSFREEGFAADDRLLLRKTITGYIKTQAYQNILFYVSWLKNARFEPIAPELPHICEGFEERYHPMNPSICKTASGYELICRAVNYTQIGANVFNTIAPDGTFRTRNFLLTLDRNFRTLSKREILENLPREHFPAYLVEGLEDCRIFSYRDGLWFTCTSCDTNPTGNRQISLCKLADQRGQNIISVEKLTPLLGPDINRCEKNWLPYVQDGALYTVYSYDPFVIYKPHPETGECTQIVSYKPTHDFSHFRGSAGPLAFDEGYLLLVHEGVILNHHRCYIHRLLQFDQNFQVMKLSKPFIFRHIGVEYCCSMTVDHSGENLILPIGVEDREAFLCTVDLDTVRSLLEPLPKP